MKKFFILIVLLSLFYFTVNSQIVDWQKYYGNIYNQEQSESIAIDKNENVYSIGYIEGNDSISFGSDTIISQIPGGFDMVILKQDKYGNEKWVKIIEGMQSSNVRIFPKKIKVDSLSNIYVAGFWRSGPINFLNTQINVDDGSFIAKLDSNGILLWERHYDSYPYWLGSVSIDVNANGDIAFCSSFEDTLNYYSYTNIVSNSGSSDLLIIKLDKNGNTKMLSTFGSSGNEFTRDIKFDSQGNMFFTGAFENSISFDSITLNGSGNRDMFISKIDSNGNVKWAYGNNISESTGAALAIDNNNNSYVCGRSGKTSLLMKYNQSGQIQWTQTLTTTFAFGTAALDIVVDNYGNPIIGGQFFGDIQVNGDNHLSYGAEDGYLACFSANGSFNWFYTYGASYTDRINSLCISQDFSKLFISGLIGETSPTGNQDYLTAKLNIPILNEIKESKSEENSLIAYPNPTNSQLFINMEGVAEGEVKLNIYNSLGKLVKSEFVNSNGSELKHQIDMSTYSKGLYILQMGNEKFRKSVKITLQ